MNKTIKKVFQNFSYTVVANLLYTLISTLVILIVPNYISTTGYGYIQLYLFYVSYTSYLSFGLTDGIYIRYGGREYNSLPKRLLGIQYWILIMLVFLSGIFVISMVKLTTSLDVMRENVIFLSFVSAIMVVPRSLITMTLLTTNRMKEYSVITIVERIFYLVGVIGLVILDVVDFKYYIYADLIGKGISCALAIWYCNDIVIIRNKLDLTIRKILLECKNNMVVGLKIVFAGLVGMLIIGIVKYGISLQWSVDTFGKISLTLSVSNMLITFINAISLAIFPIICQQSKEKVREIYKYTEEILRIILLGLLALYYPLYLIFSWWLPKYEISLKYMALLMPICLFESKTMLLINTNLKALREEKYILIINGVTVALSAILSYITIWKVHNIILSIMIITLVLGFRCILGETIISKILNIKKTKRILEEICLSIVFIIANWLLKGIYGELIYLGCYFIYIMLNRDEIYRILKIAGLLLNKFKNNN
ncbi:MAG: hypothetical protein KH355_02770 [Clostridiales bacterium]|nr:hypothetical protein [Clostridiales bacterium]